MIFQTSAEGPVFMRPNLNHSNLVPLHPGTELVPLCDPAGQNCFRQWTGYAQPLAQVDPGGGRTLHPYLPMLYQMAPFQGMSEQSFPGQGWEMLPGFTAESSTRFYKKKKRNRIVEVKGFGNSRRMRTGNLVYVSGNDIKEKPPSSDEASSSEGAGAKPPLGGQGPLAETLLSSDGTSAQKSLSAADSESSAGGDAPPPAGDKAESPSSLDEASAGGVTSPAQGEQKPSSDKDSDSSAGDFVPSEQGLTYEVVNPTLGVRAGFSQVEERKPGCVIIKKPPRQTSGSVCIKCAEEIRDHASEIRDFLSQVNQIHGQKVRNLREICTPTPSLRAVIQNFEKTCGQDFDSFFSKLYCKACGQGIPPELMLAMMTIESSGRCHSANDTDHETSLGLFQINADIHSCRKHPQRSPANRQCLMDINHNTHYGLQIILESYRLTNGTLPPVPQKGSCEEWTYFDAPHRDRWRRAVSAYNGGHVYMSRAAQAVKRALTNAPHPPHWEELRVYSFATKLARRAEGRRGGRAFSNTISNIAHTEAVLGREVKGSPPGVVEFWEQYRKNKTPAPSCPAR